MSHRRRRATPRTAEPRKLPQQPRAELTYEAILEAAERVLEEGGVAALTTNRVAEVAGVSIGSLYQYVPNKEALIRVLIERYVAALQRGVALTMAAHADAPVGEILRALGHTIVDVYRQQRRVHRHLHDLGAALGLADRREASLANVRQLVEAYLRAHPELDVRAPATAAFVIVYAVNGVVNAVAEHALVEVDAEMEEMIQMLTRYLGAA